MHQSNPACWVGSGGLFVVPDDFNDDLPDDVLAAMEGDDPLDPLRDLRP